MGKKEKRPKSKKVKIIVLSIVLSFVAILLAVFFIFVMPFIVFFRKTDFIEEDTGANLISVEMTAEQRQKDLDYMYKTVCLDNPEKERIEQVYGISYDDIYSRYQDLIVNAGSDYEYFAYLSAFLAVLPGCHNCMGLPDYNSNAIGSQHLLNELYGTQEFKDYAYSWKESFRDDVEDRLGYKCFGFTYVDGSYVCFKPDDKNEGYFGGVLVSLDGKDPKDICFDVFERQTPQYDGINKCFFRTELIFNDGTGEKHTGEIRLRDGSTVTIDLYDDPGFDSAIVEAKEIYPELSAFNGDPGSDTAETDVNSPDYIPSTYAIAKDPERKIVYVNSVSCDESEGDRLASELTQALEENDADTIILDIRSNGGGEITFVTDQLLPAVFSHDVTYTARVYGGKNSHTRKFYNNPVYRFYLTTMGDISDFSTEGNNFYYTETFTVKGNAAKDYKIYLLTSFDTFSASDVIARICKEYDNCTVVGTNTQGEGVCGSAFSSYLPESHFMFTYAPTVNTECPEDFYTGTEPDIYIPFTVDEYFARDDIFNRGTKPNSYEARRQWDKTLLKVIEMAEKD